MPIETVTTSQLNEGDTIQLNGCTMRLGAINEGPDTINKGQFGPVRWSKAEVIEQHTATIPQSWFDRDDQGRRFWQVQGNDRATWQRITQA